MQASINHNRLYWICQFTGWALFYLFYLSFGAFFAGFYLSMVLTYLVSTLFGLLYTHVYRQVINRKNWKVVSIREISIRIILASLIVGGVWTLTTVPINEFLYTVFPEDMQREREADISYTAILVINWLNSAMIIFIWSLIYFTYKYFTNFKQSEIDKWKLEAAVKDAQLLALKSQINPHFMFNCLNNIRSLVVENPEKARDMILHLSDLLRYSLKYSNQEKINLEDEMSIVKNYLTLESIQYEDRLKYNLNIHEDTLDMKIPPMAIQLLVENAIKHGISLLPNGGEIEIMSRLEEDNLVVEVINTGQLQEKNTEITGIGLQNAAERLKLLFGQLATLSVVNKDEHHVEASFTVPKLY